MSHAMAMSGLPRSQVAPSPPPPSPLFAFSPSSLLPSSLSHFLIFFPFTLSYIADIVHRLSIATIPDPLHHLPLATLRLSVRHQPIRSFPLASYYADGPISIAVDFGTTASAVAYTGRHFLNRHEFGPVRYIRKWSSVQLNSDKVPSLLSYEEPMTINRQLLSWGLDVRVRPGEACFAWFKLLLDANGPVRDLDDPALKLATGMQILQLRNGLTAIDLATDYLRCLRIRTIETITQELKGRPLPALDFWLPVPAGWSQETEDAMREAAVGAGFPNDRIHFMKEPGAALIFALEYGDLGLQEGDGVLVADLGGGTSDVACLRIQAVEPRLQFTTIVEAQGAKCGGTANLPASVKGPGSVLLAQFEQCKREYTGTTFPAKYKLRLRDGNGDIIEAVNNGEVEISNHDLQTFYNSVIHQITLLNRDQKQAADDACGVPIINKIVLVGGFAGSVYVQNSLQETFAVPNKVAVIVPRKKPELAVVIGAALRSHLANDQRSIRSEHHYGFQRPRVVEQHDPAGVQEASRFEPATIVKVAAYWVIHKDLHYTNDYRHVIDVKVEFRLGSTAVLPVYVCHNPVAPAYVTDDSTVVVDYIMLDLRYLGPSDIPAIRYDGHAMWMVPLRIETSFTPSLEQVEFTIYGPGEVNVATHQIKFHDIDLDHRPLY
ncbi:hypothetical protein BJX99DRAFT_262226 [Aspergillus californicus]